jgi:hypothetical protein
MKRKYKVLLILLALPLLDVFYACCNCNDNVEEKFYINSGFSLKNIDNSGEEPLESASENINKQAYGIRLHVNRQSLSFIKTEKYQPLFSQGAYAFSCDCLPDVTYDHTEKVESIKIITLNDFNADKLANSDITEYFKTHKLYKDVSELIKSLNYDFEYKLKGTEYFDLLLMVPPAEANVQHQFKVVITFENKQPIELLTTVNLI